MKKVSFLLVIAMLFTFVMVGCVSTQSETEEINVYNWGEYIDVETLDLFTEETGIKVNYTTVNTNEEMYAKLKAGGVAYDVIIPSDYMIGRMIEEDMLEKLDYNNIPNYAKIDENLKNPEYDPTGEYSVPYTWGTVGIIYNKTMVDEEANSWNILWDEKYAGQILMFDNSRDAIGIALKRLGYSYNTTDKEKLYKAKEELKVQKPLVQAYVMDQIFNKMEGNEAALAPYYAGDAITMMEENEDLAFVIPKEGSNIFVDAMCIPKGAKNKTGGEKFIDFMTRPDIMAMNIEEIGYSSPSAEAKQLLDADMQNNEIAYPSDSVKEMCETYMNLPSEIRTLYDELWIDILSN